MGDSPAPEVLVSFLTLADRFSNDCCERCAAMLREMSSKLDVRETSEGMLTRLIRNRCFETLDTVLEGYIAFLAQMNLDLTQTLSTLTDSRLRDLARQYGSNWVMQTRYKLPTAAKAAALLKILEYLQALDQLPYDLFDYGTSKLSSEADFDLPHSYLTTIRAALHEKMSAAVGLIEGMEMVRQRKWDQQRAAEDATLYAITSIASFKKEKAKGGAGALLLGALCSAPIWWISTLKEQNLYTGLGAAVSAILAMFFFYRSIIIFIKRIS